MIKSLLAFVESRMIGSIDQSPRREHPICRAALHHLAAGGGRVRASLCLQSCLGLGVDEADAITLAAICELLHNASLLHDDLIDRAPTRRAVQSVWAAFDDSTAVCAGDLLLSNAFALVGELSCVDRLPEILALVYRCTRNVILGQGVSQGSAPQNLEEYELLAVGKSASLLCLPLELPLLISGYSQYLSAAHRAAENFAAAYQILDDLEDYDEDVRNGALNAVSVVLPMSRNDYRSACALVSDRAEQLIHSAIEHASGLPRGCGLALMSFAEKVLFALQDRRGAAIPSLERLRHAG